jgi:hypothetical protein
VVPTDQKAKIIPQDLPERQTTPSARRAEFFDKSDAEPLGLRRVLTQVGHDLYGTKDVQDAIMATYVWMADEAGHIMLGLVSILLMGWLWLKVCAHYHLGPGWQIGGCIVSALAIFGCWIHKELQDYRETKGRAGLHFCFDSSDVKWNVKTVLFYIGVGGVLALAALIWWWSLLVVLPLVLWPVLAVAYWWLRRKLAFQQAGLPYLYRLANFTGVIKKDAIEVVARVANLKERPVSFWKVITCLDKLASAGDPTHDHLLIAGPLRSGKTSLAVGIGTEFAFALGIGRYMSAATLMELETGPRALHKNPPAHAEYNDGRVLWPPAACDLLIIDDVDSGLPTGPARSVSAVQPSEFEVALKAGDGPAPLAALGSKRTVWVLGNTEATEEWRHAIARLMGIGPEKILTIELKAAPELKKVPPP